MLQDFGKAFGCHSTYLRSCRHHNDSDRYGEEVRGRALSCVQHNNGIRLLTDLSFILNI